MAEIHAHTKVTPALERGKNKVRRRRNGSERRKGDEGGCEEKE